MAGEDDLEQQLQDDVPAAEGVDADPADAENISAPNVAPQMTDHEKLVKWIHADNIAEELEETTLTDMASRVAEEYQIDETSRSEWLAKSAKAMDLAMQVAAQKDYPWPNASNVIYPMMTVAAIEFASRATPAIIAGRNVVKGVIYGSDEGLPAIHPQDGTPLVEIDQTTGEKRPVWARAPGAKQARADRIGDHMSYQLLEEYREWRADTDVLLHILPIVGCHFRKTFFDAGERCNVSCGVTAKNLVVNYHAKSIERAPRLTEIVPFYPVEIKENENAGVWLTPKSDYGPAASGSSDKDAPHDFLEQHRLWDLDGDGYPEPYIVTVHKATRQVVRVVARFDEDGIMLRAGKIDRIHPVHYYTQFNFMPNIEGGIYGMGFGQLLKPINDAVNTTLNMLIDAGHLSVNGGGFVGKGLSMHAGRLDFKMNEWKVVNAPGGNIRDAIVPLPVKEPSATLFSLLGMLIQAGNDIAAVKDVLSGEINGVTMQPTTLLALIEQGLKVFTGIYSRVHDSLKNEYDKLYRLNRIYLDDVTGYKRGDQWKEITRQDYAQNTGVAPVSDPEMVSDSKRMAQAGILEAYKDDPLCDGMEIRRRIFKASKQENIDALFAKPSGPSLADQALAQTVENETIKTRAAAIKDLALAQKALADADKARGDAVLGVIDRQFSMLQAELQRLDDRAAVAAEAQAAPAA